MDIQTEKTIETTNYIYIIQYNPTRVGGKGYWQVKRIETTNPSETKIANSTNNPNETIESVLTNYANLVYNYLHEL